MVFVKVRETYDLHTTKNKMTVIGIHTPNPQIIKNNYPGLLMQCKAYRPVSADVVISCASVLPLDPLGVGTDTGDVAPEDVFNPILYKAMSNKGMSQLEARINHLAHVATTDPDVSGNQAIVDVDSVTDIADEFNVYYGLLSNTHEWRHANPQAGLEMRGLKPLVYDVIANVGDTAVGGHTLAGYIPTPVPDKEGYLDPNVYASFILGKPKEFPFLNCTAYSLQEETKDTGYSQMGFRQAQANVEIGVPWLKVMCGCIIVPPSRMHELFYRMVVEWTIEFSKIRSVADITNFDGLAIMGNASHYQNYSYASAKEVVTGDSNSIMDNESCMVDASVGIKKVM